jgi:hypothetical protein
MWLGYERGSADQIRKIQGPEGQKTDPLGREPMRW